MAAPFVDITVQRFSSALALFNGVDDKFRPVVYVAADEDVRFRCLIGQRIGDGIIAAMEVTFVSFRRPPHSMACPMANTT